MSEWISVKDRLPEKNGSYLCYCMTSKIRDKENWEIKQLYWESNVWLLSCRSFTVIGTVTYWTPLPKPPKEKEAVCNITNLPCCDCAPACESRKEE